MRQTRAIELGTGLFVLLASLRFSSHDPDPNREFGLATTATG
jgi:hypothetical protein